MELSTFLIVAVGLMSALTTTMLWLRVCRQVHTDEHAIVRAARADASETRLTYPADRARLAS